MNKERALGGPNICYLSSTSPVGVVHTDFVLTTGARALFAAAQRNADVAFYRDCSRTGASASEVPGNSRVL